MIDKEFEKSEEKQKIQDIEKKSMELFESIVEDKYIENTQSR